MFGLIAGDLNVVVTSQTQAGTILGEWGVVQYDGSRGGTLLGGTT